MAKPINQNTALYEYISFFHKLWKDNAQGREAESFVGTALTLQEVADDHNSDKEEKLYSDELRRHTMTRLNKYRDWAKIYMPEGLEEFAKGLSPKGEKSVKNFRAQWAVGWGKPRRNFDAAYTLAAIMAISLYDKQLISELAEEAYLPGTDLYVAPLENAPEVTNRLLDKLYSLLPAGLVSQDFKNQVVEKEENLFRMLFFGTLYVTAISDTGNSLFDGNLKYGFRDKFAREIQQIEADYKFLMDKDYRGYYKALFRHTRRIRTTKRDTASKKDVEKTFVTPRLADDWGNREDCNVIRGGINVIIGETGLGKSSLLYALASACMYDKVEDASVSTEDFDLLRKNLQQLTGIDLAGTLPVYIYATDYRADDNVRYQSVNQFAAETKGRIDVERLIAGHGGPVLILVDAIDEMAQELRRDFMTFLRRTKRSFPQATFIITTRNINLKVFDDLSSGVNCLKMIHSDENIRKMISNYITLFAKKMDAEDFYSRMKANSWLKVILRNPYQIQKAVEFTDSVRNIQPVQIYSNLITGIVEDKWGGLFPQLKSSAMVDVLKAVACSTGDGCISEKKIAGVLEAGAKQAGIKAEIDWEEFAQSIAVRSGLLLYDDEENGFRFMSTNFMCYLAARWIYQQFASRYTRMEELLEDNDIPLNDYMTKGMLAECLKEHRPDHQTLIMLFFVADFSEKTRRLGETFTIHVLTELLLESAVLSDDKEYRAQIAQLIKEDIPGSGLGRLPLEKAKKYSLTDRL